MDYVVDYSLASALFLAVIIWFYFKQKRIPNLRSRIYKLMLYVCAVSVVMDIMAVLVETNDQSYPIWFIWLCNFIFLVATQLGPTLFFFYTIVITDNWNKITKTTLCLVLTPFSLVLIGLICSLFGTYGIFYINANHIYVAGETHILLYIVASIYICLSAILVFRARNVISNEKKTVIYFFITVSIVAMGLQLANPKYLLNTTAFALAMVMIYCTLELPRYNIDVLTGAFNRRAVEIMLMDMFDRKQSFSIFLVSIKHFKTVNQQFGTKTGDEILKLIYSDLAAEYIDRSIFRYNGDTFGVILRDIEIDNKRLGNYDNRILKTIDLGEATINLTCCTAAINSKDCSSWTKLFSIMDYVMEDFHQAEGKKVILVDNEFYEKFAEKSMVEITLNNALKNDSLEVYYQPIHNGGKKVASLEALARLKTEEGNFISPEVFIRIAEKNGSINRLGKQILHKVCRFIKENNIEKMGVDYISVNLSMEQCMKENIVEELREIVRNYDINPQFICFEITETEAASSFSTVKRRMEQLKDNGFRFSLDDFGTGYANFQYIFELPFTNIKFDKSLLWSAMADYKKMNLLTSLALLIKNMEYTIICEGIETEQQKEVLNNIGVRFHQGYYYSKPLPEKELLEYLKR